MEQDTTMSQWQLNNDFYMIAYDISSDKIRDKVARCLIQYGIREQYSLYECNISDSQILKITSEIDKLINTQKDKVIYYPMCCNCAKHIITLGITNDNKQEEGFIII